ncbi:899_t:CDS:2 [Cetraspora pellucida]|uniref:899_t:CDS:1 n=1 Tax=Cetraspora pellucida TaxID=1433469 RepID=A0A9N8Z7A5_9GLOM|nr:899_t:CDS:2 [Cetraspora pellucida]
MYNSQGPFEASNTTHSCMQSNLKHKLGINLPIQLYGSSYYHFMII